MRSAKILFIGLSLTPLLAACDTVKALALMPLAIVDGAVMIGTLGTVDPGLLMTAVNALDGRMEYEGSIGGSETSTGPRKTYASDDDDPSADEAVAESRSCGYGDLIASIENNDTGAWVTGDPGMVTRDVNETHTLGEMFTFCGSQDDIDSCSYALSFNSPAANPTMSIFVDGKRVNLLSPAESRIPLRSLPNGLNTQIKLLVTGNGGISMMIDSYKQRCSPGGFRLAANYKE